MLASCINFEKKPKPDLSVLFLDYSISGEEKDSLVTIYLQFKQGGPNGNGIRLQSPASVQLDGELMRADSAKLSGVYYEVQKPIQEFFGDHEIVFTDEYNKAHNEKFSFRWFSLRGERTDLLRSSVYAYLHRERVVFRFAGLDSTDYLRVFIADTAFRSRAVNEIDTIRNNRLVLSAEKLSNLVNGFIIVQFYREVEQPILSGAKPVGRLSTSYGIEREFILAD